MSRSLIKQITQAYDYQSSIEALRDKPFQMPLDLTSPMLEYMMERSYLEDVAQRNDFITTLQGGVKAKPISWIKINRIPVHPSQAENYDLLTNGKLYYHRYMLGTTKLFFYSREDMGRQTCI